MPKEQVHFAERVGWTTSKNAKDRSNSATARASQGDQGHLGQAFPGTLGGVGERLSRFGSGKDSEKDSGYSGEPGSLPGDVGFCLLLCCCFFLLLPKMEPLGSTHNPVYTLTYPSKCIPFIFLLGMLEVRASGSGVCLTYR